METFNLSNGDLEKLEELFSLEQEIYEIYEHLAILDFNNKKDSEEYLKYLNALKGKKKEEDIYFNSLRKSPAKIHAIVKFLVKDDDPDFVGIFDYLIGLKKDDLIRFRIIERFDYLSGEIPLEEDDRVDYEFDEELDNLDEIKDYLDDLEFDPNEGNIEDLRELKEVFEKITKNFSEIEDLDRELRESTLLEESIEGDIIRTIYYMVLLTNQKVDDRFTKKLLINFNYLVAFSFTKLERELLDTSFNETNEIYWLSPLLIGKTTKTETDISSTQGVYGLDLMNYSLDNLLTLYTCDEESNIDEFFGIINSILFRIGLITSNAQTKNLMKINVLETLLDMEPRNMKVESIIRECLYHEDEDRKKVCILKLVPNHKNGE